MVFVGDAVHAGVMVHALEGQHFLDHGWVEARVGPIDVPVEVFIIIKPEAEFST